MNIVTQFLSFDKLMGQGLVKIVYYVGLCGIVLGVLFGVLGAFGMMAISFGTGLGMLIFAPIGGVIGVCFLRFACELYMVVFRMGDDLAAIRSGGSVIPPAAPKT
jgi:Domain of unknown function (DUF4282)